MHIAAVGITASWGFRSQHPQIMDPKIPILITQAILPSPLAHTRTLLPGGATWQPLLLAALLAALALISTPRLLRLARNEACLRRLPIPPTPSWLLGHLSDFAHPQHHLRLFDWATQLGPVYSLRLLTSRLVVLSDPRAAAAALRLGGGAEKPDVVYHVGNMVRDCCVAFVFSRKTEEGWWVFQALVRRLHGPVSTQQADPPSQPHEPCAPTVQLRVRGAQHGVCSHGLSPVEGREERHGTRIQRLQPQVGCWGPRAGALCSMRLLVSLLRTAALCMDAKR